MPVIIGADPGSSKLPPIFSHIPSHSLATLENDISKTILPQTMSWYPINFVIFLFSLWAAALVLDKVLLPSRVCLGNRWEACGKHRRTMIVYLLSIVVTLIAFVLQVTASSIFRYTFTSNTVELMRTAASLVVALYLFEMIYREQMRIAMLCHHTITMFAISFVLYLLYKTQDPSFILTGSLWLFQATTEQLTFAALFAYRLEWNPRYLRPMLQIAAVQSLVIKLGSVAGCIVIWVLYQKDATASYDHAWDAIFWLAAIGLMATQFWGSWVVWMMGSSLQARYDQKRAERLHRSSNCKQISVISEVKEEMHDLKTGSDSSHTYLNHHQQDKDEGASTANHSRRTSISKFDLAKLPQSVIEDMLRENGYSR